jgi:hypothetical protein
MAKLAVKPGSTDVSIQVWIQDSSSATGAGLTGLTFETASLTCYYCRPGAAAAALALATQTVDGAHSDGGFKEIDATNMPGWNRLDLSDAIVAAGVRSVGLHLHGATNMAPTPLEIDLSNQADTVGWNGVLLSTTNPLPNAAPDAAGGLPISDAGGLDLDTYIKRLEAAWTAALAARIDENISAAKTLTAAYDSAKTAAAAGAKMDLVDAPNATAITALAAGIEAAIINEGDATAVLQAIADKIAGDWTAGDLSAVAIASAVKTAMEAAGSHLTLVKAKTDNLPSDPADQSAVEAAINALNDLSALDAQAAVAAALLAYGASTYAGGDTAGTTTLLTRIVGTLLAGNHTAQSGDAYARLGAPTGASVSADVADVESKVDDLEGRLTAARAGYLDLLNTNLDAKVSTRLATTGYTAPDNTNIGNIATAVAHATSGLSALKTLIDAIPTTAAPTTAQIKTAMEAAGSHLALIKAATDNLPSDPADQSILAAAIAAVALQITALGALAITVQSPVAESGVITIYQGNDYVTAEGTALLITVAVAGAPDLTGATVRLKLIQDTWVATACTSDGTNWTIAFEPDKTETAALSVGAQPYELEATLASGSVRDLSNGTAIVVRDIPIVP